jgi:single-strand DNA-binding protein
VNDTIVTLQGWVGGDVTLRKAGDSFVASFRLGCTPRHYRRDTDTWTDDETQWFTVSAWRTLGENCEQSLTRGDAVVVQGRLRLSTWTDGNGVEQRTWEVVATSVGHDLNRGTSRFTRPRRPDRTEATTEEEVAA